MGSTGNVAKVERWVAAWNAGRLDELDAVFASGSVYHVPPFPDLVGLEAHKAFIVDARRAYPDFRLELAEVIDTGDRTALRWTWSGTFSGPTAALPVPPTGRRGVAEGAHVVHWGADGKVAEAWHLGDWLGLLQQFGVIPPP